MTRVTMNVVLCGVMAILVVGCATPTKYSWGGYESGLYKLYKNPKNAADFQDVLKTAIEKGEKKGNVPPGLYAEYGYVLLTAGKSQEAQALFVKEKEKWPESSEFMDKMIASTQGADSGKTENGGGK